MLLNHRMQLIQLISRVGQIQPFMFVERILLLVVRLLEAILGTELLALTLMSLSFLALSVEVERRDAHVVPELRVVLQIVRALLERSKRLLKLAIFVEG